MPIKLSAAGALLMLCSAPAFAQSSTSADIRQDTAQMRSSSAQVRADNAAEANLGAKVAELRSRAKHETGAKRQADLAEANRLDHQEQADHRKAQAAYAVRTHTVEDLHQDESKTPR